MLAKRCWYRGRGTITDKAQERTMLPLCVTSATCAAALAVLLFRAQPDAGWPFWKLLLGTLLLVPGQVLPLGLLWQAWQRTYFVIPFLGPPIRVGMAAVWWAGAAVVLSYIPAVAYAWKGQWTWPWVVLHPCGTVRMLWSGWKSYSTKTR
jgi:hypothetical protein